MKRKASDPVIYCHQCGKLIADEDTFAIITNSTEAWFCGLGCMKEYATEEL